MNLAKENSKEGQDMRQYMTLIKTEFGAKGGDKIPPKISPGVDLGMFLEKIGWEAPEPGDPATFERTFAA